MSKFTTGLASVSSQMTKAAKLIAATTARPTIQTDPNQSCSRPVSSMIWKAPTDTTSRIRPTTSIRALARFVSNGVSRVNTPNAQIATTGRLMKNIHGQVQLRSEEHTSELQSLMRISYAVFCLKKNKIRTEYTQKR